MFKTTHTYCLRFFHFTKVVKDRYVRLPTQTAYLHNSNIYLSTLVLITIHKLLRTGHACSTLNNFCIFRI